MFTKVQLAAMKRAHVGPKTVKKINSLPPQTVKKINNLSPAQLKALRRK